MANGELTCDDYLTLTAEEREEAKARARRVFDNMTPAQKALYQRAKKRDQAKAI